MALRVWRLDGIVLRFIETDVREGVPLFSKCAALTDRGPARRASGHLGVGFAFDAPRLQTQARIPRSRSNSCRDTDVRLEATPFSLKCMPGSAAI